VDTIIGTTAEEGCVASGTPHGWPLTFTALAEPFPGPGWQGTFSSVWPGSSWPHSIGSFSSGQHQVVLGGSPCLQP
jgi:hypothetical protein